MEEPATEDAATAGVETSAGTTEDAAEAETVTEDSPETAGAEAPALGGTAKEPVTDDDGVDGVGIPRQQSPEETADSEAADEGART